jgi:hypothetical protein
MERVPIYNPGTTINASGWISSTYVHGSANTSGNWGIRTAIKGRCYPFIGISCIGNLQSEPELIWQGQGIKSTRKSNLEKYGKELIEEMLSKFPKITEKTKEELLPIEPKENENTKILFRTA